MIGGYPMSTFSEDEAREFLDGLGLDYDTETLAVPEPARHVSEEPPTAKATEPAIEHLPGAHIVTQVLELAKSGNSKHDPQAIAAAADALSDLAAFDGTESKEARMAECDRVMQAHKASLADIPDRAIKGAYNALIWRGVNALAKGVKVEHNKRARAATKATEGDLKKHIKQTAQRNEEEFAQRLTEQVISTLLAKLDPDTAMKVAESLKEGN